MVDFLFSYVYRFLRRYLGVKRELPKDAQTLIGMIGLFDFTVALSGVFINIFLFKKNGDWIPPGLFNLVGFPATMLGFWIGGHISQRRSHLLSYQIGLLFNALVFLAILILREDARNHPSALGFVAGLGTGFYYLGQHTLTLTMTENESRDYFLSLSMFLSSVFRILAPALAGWTILAFRPGDALPGEASDSSLGYYMVFAFALVTYLGLFYRSLRLEAKEGGEGFYFWKVLTFSGNRDWNRLMGAQFVMGLRHGFFQFGVGLLVYKVSQNEAVVGSYSMISNSLALLTAYVLSLWASEKNRGWGMWVSSSFMCAACVLLSWRISYLSLMVYAVLIMVGATWFQVTYAALSFRVVEKARESTKRKLEYISIRELPLMAGRILSLSVFLAAWSRFGDIALKITLLTLGLAQMTIFFFLPKEKGGEGTAVPLEEG